MLITKFTRERETKNTVRYAEHGADHKIGVLYVQKSALATLGGDLTELEVWVGPPQPDEETQ
jgi:hypothetical protein